MAIASLHIYDTIVCPHIENVNFNSDSSLNPVKIFSIDLNIKLLIELLICIAK